MVTARYRIEPYNVRNARRRANGLAPLHTIVTGTGATEPEAHADAMRDAVAAYGYEEVLPNEYEPNFGVASYSVVIE